MKIFSAFAKILIPMLVTTGFCLASAEVPLIEMDFSKDLKENHIKQKGSLDGFLPKNLIPDFPTWNTSIAETEKLSDGNRNFLRFNVKKTDQLVLFRINGAKIEVPSYFRLDIVCRVEQSRLNIHIRQLPNPYKTFWESDVDAKQDWQTKSLFCSLENMKDNFGGVNYDTSNMALYISLQNGITDIATIKLIKISKEEYIAGKRSEIQRPEKGQTNLFRNSRFPLGLQSGWSVNRDSFKIKCESDPSNPGPSGAPSLKVSSENPFTIFSEPFQTDNPDIKNTVSFSFKGEGEWNVSIAKGGASKTVKATGDWQRESIEFKPDPLVKAFTLRFSGKGTLYIDAITAKAGTGKEASEYKSAGECEIALGLADSETAESRIQFDSEKALVKYCATGKIDGAILKTEIVNAWGESRNLADIKLGRSFIGRILDSEAPWMESGEISYDVFPETPLGFFRIEVWAERDGKRISPFNEIVISRVKQPVYWGKDAPDSPFGNHFTPNEKTVLTMKAGGINWERFNDSFMEGSCWGWIEKEKGKLDFPDEKIASYRKANIKLLGYLGSAPTWATDFKNAHSFSYFNYMYQPRDLEAFRKYVKETVTHYKGVIDEYQAQNEPWGASFWHIDYDPKTGKFNQGENPAKAYAEISKITYEEMKKVNPAAKLYGFNTCPAAWMKGKGKKSWTEDVYSYGAYPYCDMIDYHFYSDAPCGYPGDGVETAWKDSIGYLKEKETSPLKNVVMSEGHPASTGAVPSNWEGKNDFAGHYNYSIPWKSNNNPILSADAVCRFVISHLAMGVKRIFLYSDHCYSYLAASPTFPVLLGGDGYPHPSLAAFSNMAYNLEDKSFVKRISVGENVWAYIFEGKGKTVAVITGYKQGKASFMQAEGLNFLDLFGNLISGKVEYRGTLIYVQSGLPLEKLEKTLSGK